VVDQASKLLSASWRVAGGDILRFKFSL